MKQTATKTDMNAGAFISAATPQASVLYSDKDLMGAIHLVLKQARLDLYDLLGSCLPNKFLKYGVTTKQLLNSVQQQFNLPHRLLAIHKNTMNQTINLKDLFNELLDLLLAYRIEHQIKMQCKIDEALQPVYFCHYAKIHFIFLVILLEAAMAIFNGKIIISISSIRQKFLKFEFSCLGEMLSDNYFEETCYHFLKEYFGKFSKLSAMPFVQKFLIELGGHLDIHLTQMDNQKGFEFVCLLPQC